MAEESYDVVIMGGGPAGLTAGLYTSRHGLRTLILEGKQLGGKSWGSHRVENYPGFPEGSTGTELMDKFIAQTRRFGAEIKEETVVGLSVFGDQKMVQTRGGVYGARAVVIATGIQKRQLSVLGEDEFKGRGVSYCVICDGPFFKDKDVAVMGSGREAVEDALKLAETASRVYAIPGSKGYNENIEELHELVENPKIQVVEGADLDSIGGDMVVTHVNLNKEPPGRLDVDGVFIILEQVATTDLMKEAGVETDEGGCIIVDKHQKTSLDGVYAAGDCVCGGMQVVTAAGEGGRAGLSVLRYVRSLHSFILIYTMQ
jgi:thioredoxin reductase (NADPH)